MTGRGRLGLMATTDYGAMLGQAVEAGRRRDYARAVDLLTRIVGGTDQYPQALLYLGRAYHALGDHANAAQVLQFYVRSRPTSLPGNFFLGRAYLGMGEFALALRHLKRAVEQDPSFSPAYGLLGLTCLKAHRPDKAIWWFAKALEVDPQNKRLQVGYLNTALVLAIRLYFRGELVDSARLFNEVLEQRRASILPHLYLASIYRELGNGGAALYHLEAASRISPQDPYLHLQRAVVLLAQGDKAAAAEEIRAGAGLLKSTVSPGTTPTEVLRYITVNLFREGRYREAVFYGGRLLRNDYSDSKMHALVAESYRNLGDPVKARNHYQRAIEGDKASMELRYGLLAVLWELEDYDQLMREAARILQRDGADGPAHYFHSLALSRTGAAIEQVLSELQQQIHLRGPDPVLMAELAAAYVRAGMPQLAEGWFTRSMKLRPASPETLLALGAVYESLGKAGQVGETYARYLELKPEDRPVRRRLVRLLLEQQSFEAAAGQIRLLLPVEPDNDRLKSALAVCYRRTGRYGEALILIRELLIDAPSSVEHMKAAVYCLDRMGARPVALKALASFMSDHGESLSLLLMRGVLHYQDGALEKSAETFRRAVSLAPDDWRANRNLGMVYRRMGNDLFAEKFLQKARERQAAEGSASAVPAPRRRKPAKAASKARKAARKSGS
jgi:Flp pilus assembly protein TadD